MNQDISDIPLPLLIEQFKQKHPDLDVNSFISWKTKSNNNELISEFYNYPFLRDQLFLSFIKTIKPDNLTDFENLVLKLQCEYFKKFIKPEFDPEILKTTTAKVSKCPFAPKTTSTPIKPFSYEPISKIRYSFIENTHISDMMVNNLTVNIVKPDCQRTSDAKFHVFTSGIHRGIDFCNPNVQYIIMSDTKFYNTIPISRDRRLIQCTTNEILKVKSVLTVSDLLFLFPDNVLVINPSDFDRLLNMIVYLNIFNLPPNLNILRTIGLGSKSLPPSFLEPYADILTPQYIQNNIDLFQ